MGANELKKINKIFKDEKVLYTYNYPSMMCGLKKVHKGIIAKNGALDFCIPYNEAIDEIKELEEKKKEKQK